MNKTYRRRSEAEVAGYLSIPMNTLVVYHARPDGDTVGCAIALAEAMRALGSRAYFTGVDEVPERLRFLCPADFVSAKYENLPSDFVPERIITVDAAAPELVGEIYGELCGRIDLMIDHHEFNSPFADNCIDHTAAACGEVVKRIIFMMFEHPTDIPRKVLDCIYAAISSDTGCFKYSNVTPDTHKTAAGLICLGVNAAEINTLLFDTKSEKQLRAESLAALLPRARCAPQGSHTISSLARTAQLSRPMVVTLPLSPSRLSTRMATSAPMPSIASAIALRARDSIAQVLMATLCRWSSSTSLRCRCSRV